MYNKIGYGGLHIFRDTIYINFIEIIGNLKFLNTFSCINYLDLYHNYLNPFIMYFNTNNHRIYSSK